MQTYSHLLITAAVSIPLAAVLNSSKYKTRLPKPNTKAILFGSVLPDLNPIVISLQNTFHSPVVLIALIMLCYFTWRKQTDPQSKHPQSIYSIFFWIFCAALLHTLIDIPLHSTDGPLVFFPFNWHYRFASPISYWDPNYYGHIWTIFEHSLDSVIIVLLIFYWRKHKIK